MDAKTKAVRPLKTRISALLPDQNNANRGTPRGAGIIEESLRLHGAGRSILIDKNNRIIAGNKTAENAGQIGMEDVIVVESDARRTWRWWPSSAPTSTC